MRKLLFLLCLLSFILGCKPDTPSKTGSSDSNDINNTYKIENTPTSSKQIFRTVPHAQSGLHFQNTINEDINRNVLKYEYFYNGGGIGMADFNNDGLTDVFLTGNDSPNKLFKNNGNLKFEDVSSRLPKESKWTSGVTIVDINGDGLQDIYLCNSGPDGNTQKLKNQLLVNKGNFRFKDEAESYGIADASQGVQAAFFDIDNDGDLDLWINNHGLKNKINDLIKENKFDDIRNGNLIVNLNKLKDNAVSKGKIQLYRNDGGSFINISREAGVNYLSFGLGLSVADLNDDGYLDVYIANDYFVPDFVFFNNKAGGFRPDISKMNHTSYYSMGVDAGDINNDGILDLMVVDMTPQDHYRNKTLMESMNVRQFNVFTNVYKFPRAYMFNSFQLGVGNGYFSEIANGLNMALTEWSWAPLFMDMDNDGHQDLYITNGFLRDTKNQDHRRKEELRQEKNKGQVESSFEALMQIPSNPIKNAVFKNNSNFNIDNVSESASDMGPSFSNGAAYGDLDNDGDLDLIINNLNEPATLLENVSQDNYLKVKLTAENPAAVRHAQITISTTEGIQRRDYNFTRGYLSYMEPIVHFGLGNSKIKSLKVKWLDGSTTNLSSLEPNQTLTIDYDSSQKEIVSAPVYKKTFNEVSNVTARSNLFHQEEFYDDFEKEILLPQKYSSLGPALVTEDLDNNGKYDLFLGGSKGFPGKVYLTSGFSFVQLSPEVFQADAEFEDIGAAFFDANNDGKLDLYVCSGGSTEVKEEYLQDRLYLNVKGGFKKSTNALPKMLSSTQAVIPFDFDKDGDMDLFVGGRNKPGHYPDKATSYLLINNNGQFKILNDKYFYEQVPNMVTSAETIDINKDGFLDLVIVGEWSQPKIFINKKGQKLEYKKYPELDNLKGWWYKVQKIDLDNDGLEDLVLGNLGVNNKFHASQAKPLRVYYDDFDDNGTIDIFLAKNYKGKIVPVRGKECSSEQMPILNEKFKSYHDFASASLIDVLGNEKLESCGQLETSYFKSIVLMNKGDNFEIVELPAEAQWSPILDIEAGDYNQDGNKDLIIAGNIFNSEPETPSYDASHGTILYGRGDGTFDAEIDVRKTGLNLNKNVKNIATLKRPEGTALIIANNNDLTQLYFPVH